MKSIARKDFIYAGTIDKTHGTKGELNVTLTSNKSFKKWAFLEIQGKPVPFYIESILSTFDDRAIIKLQDIQTIETASSFVGNNLLIPIGKRSKSDFYAEDDFTGFALVDENIGHIGLVAAIEEFPNQILIKTHYEGREVLIPAVPAFIKQINESEKTIYLILPEGLLNI